MRTRVLSLRARDGIVPVSILFSRGNLKGAYHSGMFWEG